ncbi:hypothetical protein [Burkholderia vietnamiensis]|uniref:hypothetical protein n=1 Tax=Burkholderia vietnamiensis TaxID=60552 RepID=UPI001B9EE07D|nr:hypothetical protein [Burkholderia vietnamiensis]MBR8219081.1 hypothetical protein [Burkholderia vietnamiensis]
MTTDNEKGPLNQMESGQEKRSASEARALSEIVNGTPTENLCRRGSPAPKQASETTAQQPRMYTTQPAESVMGIALRQCGNEMEWRHILACNPEFARMLPHEYFPVGTVLNLPPHPAAASRFEQPEKSLAPEGRSEARGRWIQANCPTGDIIKSPSPSNNREFPTSMSESDCEHRIALAPSQPAAAPIDSGTVSVACFSGSYPRGTITYGQPAPSPADTPIAYDGLTEEFADEVARLANDAPGIREAVAGALESCKAIIAPQGNTAPSPADERAAWDRARESLAVAMAGFASRSGSRDFNAALSVLDAITEPGLPLLWLRTARAASANETGAEGAAWRELCRRLYVELFHCDQQMRSTRDEDGEPHWTQSAVVRDVLADAKAALDAAPQPAQADAQDVPADDLVGFVYVLENPDRPHDPITRFSRLPRSMKGLGAKIISLTPVYSRPAQADARVGLTDEQREAIGKASEVLSILTGHDAYPNMRHRFGNDWWEPINMIADALRALLQGANQ